MREIVWQESRVLAAKFRISKITHRPFLQIKFADVLGAPLWKYYLLDTERSAWRIAALIEALSVGEGRLEIRVTWEHSEFAPFLVVRDVRRLHASTGGRP